MERPPLSSFITASPTAQRPPLDSFFSKQQPKQEMGVIEDVARSGLSGVVKGIPNLIDFGASGVATLADEAGQAVGLKPKRSLGETFGGYAQQQNVSKGIDSLLGTKEHTPQTTVGRYANFAGQAVGSLPLMGISAAAQPVNAAKAIGGGVGAGAGGDIGAPVGGYAGEIIAKNLGYNPESGRQTGEALGMLGGTLAGGVYGANKAGDAVKSFERGFSGIDPTTPPTREAIKEASQLEYQNAEKAGGILTPKVTNSFIDNASKTLAPQTSEGRVILGDSAATKLSERMDALKDRPLSLQAAQEIDEGLSSLINAEYGLKGMSKEGTKILNLQQSFRDAIKNAGEADIVGGRQGFDAWKKGQQLWHQQRKMSDIERIIENANMTDNPATAIKTGAKNLLKNKAAIRGFNDDEVAAIQQMANRGVVGGTLSVFGSRLIPMVSTAAGAVGGGGVGGALAGAAVGQGASSAMRAGATAIQNAKANRALETIGRGRAIPSMAEKAGMKMRDLFGRQGVAATPPTMSPNLINSLQGTPAGMGTNMQRIYGPATPPPNAAPLPKGNPSVTAIPKGLSAANRGADQNWEFNPNSKADIARKFGIKAESLSDFVQKNGGLKIDNLSFVERENLKHVGVNVAKYQKEWKGIFEGEKGARLRMVRQNGKEQEEMARMAAEMGYLPDKYRSGGNEAVEALKRALRDDIKGKKVWTQDVYNKIEADAVQAGANKYAESIAPEQFGKYQKIIDNLNGDEKSAVEFYYKRNGEMPQYIKDAYDYPEVNGMESVDEFGYKGRTGGQSGSATRQGLVVLGGGTGAANMMSSAFTNGPAVERYRQDNILDENGQPIQNQPQQALLAKPIKPAQQPDELGNLINSIDNEPQQAPKTISPTAQFLDKIKMAESGGNRFAKSTTSSAAGPFQFTRKTWKKMLDKYAPDELKNLPQAMALRTDPQLSEYMAEKLSDENAANLEKRNVPVNTGSLYVAHFAGGPRAARLYTANPKAPASRFFAPFEIEANKSILKNKTVGQVIAILEKKVK